MIEWIILKNVSKKHSDPKIISSIQLKLWLSVIQYIKLHKLQSNICC
jgi:hypothetical protein